MKSLNRDLVIAILLVVMTSLFFWETFSIPDFGYSSMQSSAWPRIILVPLFVLCVAYVFQSLRRGAVAGERTMGLVELATTYRNPILSFLIFFIFLLTLDYLGMLLGGGLLVFGLLSVLGVRTPKAMIIHALIAVISVGLVWALFTYVLRVYLPEGELLRIY